MARDAAGHETTTTVSVAVLNDTAAPTVAVTSPAVATTVSGTVTVTATASDDVGVTSVQFLVDGAALGAADTAAPYEVAWPTDAVPNGAQTLTAVARDAAGRETTQHGQRLGAERHDGPDGGGDQSGHWHHARRHCDGDRDGVG